MKEDEPVLRQYILVTPVKNEEENLPNLIRSVEEQTIKPALWIIVDDGSTDRTPKIVAEAKKNHNWIQSIRLKEEPRDITIHYTYVCKMGFDYATEYCKEHDIKYSYIGLVDGDMILYRDFFEKLIKEFEKNLKLGIASGGIYYKIANELVLEKGRKDIPIGGARLWKRQCFEETDGYVLAHASDTISNVKAKLRGWDTKRFEEYKAIQIRATCSAEGFWKGYKKRGEMSYYIGYNPFFSVLRGVRYLFKRPYYIGIAYLQGYFSSIVLRKKQFEDKEVVQYYRNMRPQELKERFWNKIKKLFR